MFDPPDTSQWGLHALHIMERARTLRLEMQDLRQQSFRLQQESRRLCRERIPPQTVCARSVWPQMSEPPPLTEAATVWVREMTRAFQLCFELDIQVRRSAEVIAAVQAVREQVPDLADWVLPDLFHREPVRQEPARPAPVLPQDPLVLEITVRVLECYNWEPISRSRRTWGSKTDASERQSA
jgi:hypothetical protein